MRPAVARNLRRCPVPLARLIPQLSAKAFKVLLFCCLLATLCLTVAAQSGRKAKPAPAPSEPVRPDKPAPRISSLVVCGHDISKDGKELYSNSVSLTVKAITDALNERRGLVIGVLNGGKRTRRGAVARGRGGPVPYFLGAGNSPKLLRHPYERVEYLDYVVYKPQT